MAIIEQIFTGYLAVKIRRIRLICTPILQLFYLNKNEKSTLYHTHHNITR